MRGRGALFVALAVTVLVAPVDARAFPATTLVVDVARPIGSLNRDLVGFGWHDGGAPLASVAPLHPRLIRIDASLQDVSTGPGEPLRLDRLLQRVATARAVGEPLVILSYLPAWLGAPVALGRDPSRVRPADLDAWERVVHDVVLALATAPAPAFRFEAWNEPDVPIFWQDTPLAWVDTVERTARAVAAVERQTGLDLAFGGPAVAFPDPVYLVPFLARFRDPTLPLDFVSWHYYGNYPFFGPDGAEFPITEPIQPVLGQRNPLASPTAYGLQVEVVRAMTEATLAGSGRPPPALVLDEWNLSAGGFDRRHDTAEGAAFAAGVLIELQAASVDAAAFFRANDVRGVTGEHGAVTVDGIRKPVWWTFDLWQQLAPTRVAVSGTTGALDGLWTVATADDQRVVVLVASFRATPGPHASRPVAVDVRGRTDPPVSATVRRIDDAHPAAAMAEPLDLAGATIRFDLPTPGVALVEVQLDGARP